MEPELLVNIGDIIEYAENGSLRVDVNLDGHLKSVFAHGVQQKTHLIFGHRRRPGHNNHIDAQIFNVVKVLSDDLQLRLVQPNLWIEHDFWFLRWQIGGISVS